MLPFIDEGDWTDSYLDKILYKMSMLREKCEQPNLSDESKEELCAEIDKVQAELVAFVNDK